MDTQSPTPNAATPPPPKQTQEIQGVTIRFCGDSGDGMQLTGSVALVTGGASGLGAATVRALVGKGAKALIVDRDEAKGQALAAELGDAAAFAKADVTDAAQIEAAIEAAQKLGTLRIAVSCAGVGWASRTLDKTVITTYGRDFAVASTLSYRAAAPGKVGRQMQTWVRFPEGWRIVAAHVSTIDEPR